MFECKDEGFRECGKQNGGEWKNFRKLERGGNGWLAVRVGSASMRGMSRRSKKRQGRRGGGWLVKFLVGVVVLMILALAGLQIGVRNYLRGEKFRMFLSEKVSEELEVEGEFSLFRWDGLAVGVDGFEGAGERVIRKLEVEDLHTEIGLGGFWRGVWEVEDFQMRSLSVVLGEDSEQDVASVTQAVEEPDAKEPRGWLPREVEVQRIGVESLNLRYPMPDGELEVRGVEVTGRSTLGGGYDVLLKGGEIHFPMDQVQVIRLVDASLRYRDSGVFLNSAQARVMEDALLEVSGEYDKLTRMVALQGGLSGVDCRELLNEDWKQRVSGQLATNFQLVQEDKVINAKGRVVLTEGVLTALPFLDMLAKYTDTRRFRVLHLSEAHSDWTWQEDQWTLNNLVLASEGLLRLEGDLTVRGQLLDGKFRLGIAPGTLSSIPGAELRVFLPGEKGLLWAPVNITGTLDDPLMDLKQRLIQAAGERVLTMLPDEGLKVLEESGKSLDDVPKKLIEEGVNVLEDVGGILDGVLGGRR